jgi:23S rRNA pseudouridine2604 synthase
MEKVEQKNEITYPMRINRYLALNNYCSRREADKFIAQGIVTINGKKAKLGDKVNADDVIKFGSKTGETIKKYAYFAYNKPKGVVTHSPEKGQKSIQQTAHFAEDVFPVGRLDKESHGLIILSNDGRITDKLLNPSREHEKEYIVKVNKPITNIFLKIMRQGVQLEDFKTKPCIVEKKDETTFNIVLTEGKKHQIRRMCANLGWEVADLKRIRIMNIKLGNLGLGQQRKIKGEELALFLKNLGMAS